MIVRKIAPATMIFLILFIIPLAYGNKNIEGDWEVILTEMDQKYILKISTQPDGTLAAVTPDGIALDKVTFENGKVSLEGGSPKSTFEGTLKEDGLSIEGTVKQQEIETPAVLKRIQKAEALTRTALQTEAQKVKIKSGGESDTEVAKTSEPRKKLIARWRLDNDANDSAGALHGNLHGDPTFDAGKLGQAIKLDGDDYVDCGNPDALNFGTGDWAISAWFKTTQTGTIEGDDQMNRGTIFAKGGDETDGIRYALAINENELGMMTLTTDDNEHSKVQTMGDTRVNDGAWHHVVGMRISNQMHLYIDGKLNGRSLFYDDYDLSGVSQHNAYIGTITDNRDQSLYKYFVGMIDEVCVFACALDMNSISALYSGADPTVVAEQVKAITEPKPQPQQIDVDIEGDWKGTVEAQGFSCVIKIREKSDGTPTATLIADETTIPFNKVTFANGTLRLEAMSVQISYEGTVKEDGSTIEGFLVQPNRQLVPLILKRIEQAQADIESQSDSDTTTGPPDQPLVGQSDGGGSLVTTLVLILILVGMIGGIVLFIMKSSIRK